MARTSKYFEKNQAPSSAAKVWKTALYVRLSREDGDKPESESVNSQKAFLANFLLSHSDLEFYRLYVDDGWSGTNFERPQFKTMIEDIRAGAVNCVVVKDLSRFGRNYIEAGRYLETFFPMMRVRFIAVNDNIDSYSDPRSINNAIVPMKNVMNDEYCRDISMKVRSSLDTRRAQGKFIGAFAAYGYRKDPENHNRLIVDQEAAEVVRSIFRLFLGGMSVIGIAKHLNALGIPNPSEYKRRMGDKYRHPAGSTLDGLWPDSSVRRILKNELYTGVMVQGKNETVSYKVNISRAVEPESWFRVENTHEAIISRDIFDAAQRLFARDTRTPPKARTVGLFAGLIKCADCGRAMNKKSITHRYGVYQYYICSTYKKMKNSACSKHTIRADKLENAVLVTLQKQISLAVDMEALIKTINESENANSASQRLEAALAANRTERRKAEGILLDLYPDYKIGLLSEQQYRALKERYERQLESLDATGENLREQLEKRACGVPDGGFIGSFAKHRNLETLNREILTELVENIYVHEGGAIEIVFRYCDAFALAAEYIENNRHLLESA